MRCRPSGRQPRHSPRTPVTMRAKIVTATANRLAITIRPSLGKHYCGGDQTYLERKHRRLTVEKTGGTGDAVCCGSPGPSLSHQAEPHQRIVEIVEIESVGSG